MEYKEITREELDNLIDDLTKFNDKEHETN